MRAGIALILAACGVAAQTAEPPLKGSIRGTVQDSAGHPLAGVVVQVEGAEPATRPSGNTLRGSLVTKATDPAGKYVVAELAPGTYFVRGERIVDPAGYRQVTVDGGQDTVVDFVIPADPVLFGRVLDPSGEPAAGAPVYLLTSEYRAGLLRPVLIGPRKTHSDGTYSFDSGLQARLKYYVLVGRDVPQDLKDREEVEVPTYYPSAVRIDSASPIVLQPGEQRGMVNVKISRSPLYCISGKVQGAGGFQVHSEPLVGTRMVRAVGFVKDGPYRACGLPPGDYRLTLQNSVTEFTISTSDREHVDLVATLALPRIQIDWDDSAAKMSANGLFSLRLNLTGVNGASSISHSSGVPSSTQLLHGISPGDYELGLETFGNTPVYPKEITWNSARLTDNLLRLPPDSDGTLHIVLARDVATIAVSVADAAGKAVPYAAVLLVPDAVTSARQLSHDGVHGTTGPNGTYTSPPLIPGRYRVLATAQTVRWNVPEDLEHVLPVLFQGEYVDAAPKASVQVAVTPVVIF